MNPLIIDAAGSFGEVILSALGTVIGTIVSALVSVFDWFIEGLLSLAIRTPYPVKSGTTDEPALLSADSMSSSESGIWETVYSDIYLDVALPYAIALFMISLILAYFGKLLEGLPAFSMTPDLGKVFLLFLVSIVWFPILSGALFLSDSLGQVLSLDALGNAGDVGGCEQNGENICPDASFSDGAAESLGQVLVMIIYLAVSTGLFIAALVFWVLRLFLLYALGGAMPILFALMAFDEVNFPFLGDLGTKGYDAFWFVAFANIPAALILGIGTEISIAITDSLTDVIGIPFLSGLVSFMIKTTIPLLAFLSPFYFLLTSRTGKQIMSASTTAVSGGATAAAGAAGGLVGAKNAETKDRGENMTAEDYGGGLSGRLRSAGNTVRRRGGNATDRLRSGGLEASNTMYSEADSNRFKDALETGQRRVGQARAVGSGVSGNQDTSSIAERYGAVDEDDLSSAASVGGAARGAADRVTQGGPSTASEEARQLSNQRSAARRARENQALDTDDLTDAQAAALAYESEETDLEYSGDRKDLINMMARGGVSEDEVNKLEAAGFDATADSIAENSEAIKEAGILSSSQIKDIQNQRTSKQVEELTQQYAEYGGEFQIPEAADMDAVQQDDLKRIVRQSDANSMDEFRELTTEELAEQTDYDEGEAKTYLDSIKRASATQLENYGDLSAEDRKVVESLLTTGKAEARFGGESGINIDDIVDADDEDIGQLVNEQQSLKNSKGEGQVDQRYNEVQQEILDTLEDLEAGDDTDKSLRESIRGSKVDIREQDIEKITEGISEAVDTEGGDVDITQAKVDQVLENEVRTEVERDVGEEVKRTIEDASNIDAGDAVKEYNIKVDSSGTFELPEGKMEELKDFESAVNRMDGIDGKFDVSSEMDRMDEEQLRTFVEIVENSKDPEETMNMLSDLSTLNTVNRNEDGEIEVSTGRGK